MKLDAITLAVMNNRLAAIADEMGGVLGQTAFSPHIKERHDFSCAIFDARGEIARDVMTLFLANTRVREEREGDLRAQIAALSVGSERLLAIVKTSGRKTVEAAMDGLKDYAERLMIAALKELRPGTYRAEDFLDDDGFGTGPIPICVAIKIGHGKAIVDFAGSAPQVRGSVNANYAITLSATFYAMKCLAAEAVPANEGLMRPIKLIAPPGSIVNSFAPSPGAGGERENPPRILDRLLSPLPP